MSTLKDIKVFAQAQENISADELEAKIAKEFEMSRDEAAQVMRGLVSEDPSLEVRSPSLLQAGVVAAGLAGTMQVGGTQNAVGVGALLVSETAAAKTAAAKEAALENDNTPSR